MIAFGPVPSRRLGRSLGINNIPPKVCSYSCVYCQVGRTIQPQIERQVFYQPDAILDEVRHKVESSRRAGVSIDYLTFVPDGEPTLDLNLGRTIELLRPLGIRIAVITNSSLLWMPEVRDDLHGADWVGLKVDSVREKTWRKIDRPNSHLQLAPILDGMLAFAASFDGTLTTETMLVNGLNDGADELRELAEYVARLKPATAYLAIPTRPPAEDWVRAPDEETVNRAYHMLREKLSKVECLTGYEGNAFASTGNVAEDLLAITAVHPMREDAVRQFLSGAGTDFSVVERLVDRQQLVEVVYQATRFYLRRFSATTPRHLGNVVDGEKTL